MKPSQFKHMLVAALLVASTASVFASVTAAQVETQTTTTAGAPTRR